VREDADVVWGVDVQAPDYEWKSRNGLSVATGSCTCARTVLVTGLIDRQEVRATRQLAWNGELVSAESA